MLVGELLPGEKHRNPDRRHQANKGQLDPLLDLLIRHTVKHRKQPLLTEALYVVAGNVIHRLSAVGKHAAEPAVDRLAHSPLKVVAASALAEDRCADAVLKVIVPQPVQTALAEQAGWAGQFLADDQ